jgi:hypothetical protein
VNVSAATIRRGMLEPALDARAINIAEERQCESLLDHIANLHPAGPGSAEVAEIRRLALLLHDENSAEGDLEREVIHNADTLTRDLRGVELNGVSGVLTAKCIARLLREPLNVLCDMAGHDAHTIVHAARQVDDVIRQVPTAQLLAPQVRHELWHRRFDLLCDLHARRTRRASETAPAASPGAKSARRRNTSPAAGVTQPSGAGR